MEQEKTALTTRAVQERPTKRTQVCREVETELKIFGPMGTIHLSKDALEKIGNPKRIRVTIEPDEEGKE